MPVRYAAIIGLIGFGLVTDLDARRSVLPQKSGVGKSSFGSVPGASAPSAAAGSAAQMCVLTREQILNQVWDYDFGGDARVLETYISYLRKKLDAHGPSLIHTVRGVGYALRQPRT